MATSESAADVKYNLVGTYTRYSSWTVRIETLLEYFQIPYVKNYVPLPEVRNISPSELVPVLEVPSLDLAITDSISISEFLAEDNPSLALWPKDQKLRALARSAVAQMHSGFSALRNTYPTNFVAKYEGPVPVSEAAKKEVVTVLNLWTQARKTTVERLGELGDVDEGYLFGAFGIADAFFWPVLWRFRTYNLPLDTASPEALDWIQTMWKDTTLKARAKDYFRQSERPETLMEQYEDIYKGNPEISFGRFNEDWEFSSHV